MRLTFTPFHSRGARAVLMVCLRRCSSGSKSVVEVPSSTLPKRSTALAAYSAASTSEVLPVPPCPTTATLRIRSGGYGFTPLPPHPGRRDADAPSAPQPCPSPCGILSAHVEDSSPEGQ